MRLELTGAVGAAGLDTEDGRSPSCWSSRLEADVLLILQVVGPCSIHDIKVRLKRNVHRSERRTPC